jgi:hypothetical protein
MASFGFYRQCLRHAPKESWAWIGTISTLSTFAIPAVARIIKADSKTVDTLLLVSAPFAVLVCFIIVPFREAFRLYREKEEQLEAEKTRHAEEQRRWESERAEITKSRFAENVTAEAKSQLAKLCKEDRELLRQLVLKFQINETKFARLVPGASIVRIKDETDFVHRNTSTGDWRVVEDWHGVLTELLVQPGAVI